MQQKLLDSRYETFGLLGSGGMAKVYLAHDTVLGRDVALKVLREQYAENDEFVERFRREAQAAASLSHPNIVATYDRGRSQDGSYYIVMEYVPGGTLKDHVIRNGPVGPDRAAELAAQIASALGAAHQRGVIHRDVKPQNVLLTASGDAKVTDFGIARAASESSLSGTSMILGTVSYMSPEQAMGKVVGPRSDLYSLGVVLHEMLAGRVPFEAETPMAVSMKHVHEPPPPLRETSHEVFKGLNAIRAKLLAKDPEHRYASSAEVVEDLRRVRRGQEPALASLPSPSAEGAPTGLPPEPRAAVRRRRKRPFVWSTGAALVGIFGLIGAFGWGVSDSQGRQPDAVIEEARQIITGKAEVSRVIGLDRAEAQRRLIGRGFEVDVRLRESSTADAGKVLAQSIPGGEEAEKGTKVVLDVGEGPDPVPAPELGGLTLADAEYVLGEAGLKVGEKGEKPSDTSSKGTVIEQNPPAGEKVETGTTVDLTLSSGPTKPAPAKAAPVEPTPAEPVPAEPAPAEPASVEPTPVEPAPVEPTPVEPAPVEPAPVEPVPVEPTLNTEPTPAEPPPSDANAENLVPADPLQETEAEPLPEQYDSPPRQYEPASPAGTAGAAPATPATRTQQYDPPPVQSSVEKYIESVMKETGVLQPAPLPQDRGNYEDGEKNKNNNGNPKQKKTKN